MSKRSRKSLEIVRKTWPLIKEDFAYEPAYNPIPWPVRNSDDPLTELAIRTLSTGTSYRHRINAVLEQGCALNLSTPMEM